MSNIKQDLLLFGNWLEAMEDIKATDFKKLIYAMYSFQTKGEQPVEFKGKAKIAAAMIFPMLKRRIELSEYGAKGAEKRLSKACDGIKSKESEFSMASSQPQSPPQAIEENRKENNRIDYSSPQRSAEQRGRGARTRQGRVESEEEKEKWADFFDEAVARTFSILEME